jgi:hypothetical protein
VVQLESIALTAIALKPRRLAMGYSTAPTALIHKILEKTFVTDTELEQLQLHVDELERKRGSESVHHHEDQNTVE